jgi:hypothetical protein
MFSDVELVKKVESLTVAIPATELAISPSIQPKTATELEEAGSSCACKNLPERSTSKESQHESSDGDGDGFDTAVSLLQLFT